MIIRNTTTKADICFKTLKGFNLGITSFYETLHVAWYKSLCTRTLYRRGSRLKRNLQTKEAKKANQTDSKYTTALPNKNEHSTQGQKQDLEKFPNIAVTRTDAKVLVNDYALPFKHIWVIFGSYLGHTLDPGGRLCAHTSLSQSAKRINQIAM
jgi:hypothetical protein